MANARSDDSHDGRYTHPTTNEQAAPTEGYPKMLHGKPYVKDGRTIRDTVIVKDKAAEDEAMASGAWKDTPAKWLNPSGFSRLRAMLAMVVLGVFALVAVPFGQAAMTLTSLAAALPAPTQGNQQLTVSLAAATNVSIGQGLYVDTEYMRVTGTTPISTSFTVSRGQQGTPAAAHNSGAIVFVGSPSYFSDRNNVSGACVSTQQLALPRVTVQTGQIANCPAVSTLAGSATSNWDQWSLGGFQASSPARQTGWTYVTAGALTIQGGTSLIGSSGALTMTLAAPTTAMNGLIMNIQASTAQAHLVDYTAGFYGTTTSSDRATFGGAIGDNFVIYAINGTWRIFSLHNVTIG